MSRTRRAAVRALLAGGIGVAVAGHTPYRQWVVYRRRHLLLGCHRRDPATYDIAREAAALLAEHLPDATARVARAPDARRLASLLSTGQLEVAILAPSSAADMAAGRADFTPYGAVPLRCLLPLADRVLVAEPAFPERHAWLVTRALVGTELCPEDAVSNFQPPVAWHSGARAALDGRPEPPDAVR